MRDYFLLLLSDMMNAINIPKDIISANTLSKAISSTPQLGKSPAKNKLTERQVPPNPSCEAGLLIEKV
jgi:hypothetical protein